MKLEILLSCMNEKNFDFLDKFKLESDILIVNQCDENGYMEERRNGHLCRMLKTTRRGLSQSRNELLNNMIGDIGILCDDDVIYYKNYNNIILKAFNEIKEADIIIFDIERINYKNNLGKEQVKSIKKASKYKNYGSVRIAFKKESFYKNNLWFNLNFGTGGKYSSGEESLLLRDANGKRLKIYEYPAIIARVDYSESSWFKGFDEKYFYDKGAWLKEAYPKTYFLFKWYFIFKLFNKSDLKWKKILENINNGIKGYKLNLSFKEYKRI